MLERPVKPTPPRPPLVKEEVILLRDARELREMMGTRGWEVYKRLVQEQMKTRLDLVMKPGHDLNQVQTEVINGQPSVRHVSIDGITRYGSVEHIKGAYNGLGLALSLPVSTVAEADRIREEASPTEETVQ